MTETAESSMPSDGAPENGASQTKTCPECAEEVKAVARVCRFCGYRFEPSQGRRRRLKRLRSRRRRRRPGFWKRHWRKFAMVVPVLAALAVIGVAVALNWDPEPVFDGVEAPRYDPDLAAGGLPSSKVGADVVLESLKDNDAVAIEILADASEEGVIDSFAEAPPKGKWEARYDLDGGAYVLRFDTNDDEFLLTTRFGGDKKTADEIFAIGRRYGYYDKQELREDRELDDRTHALLEAFGEREFFAGESEPDLAAEAAALVDAWNSWLERYGEFPPKARLIEAKIQLLEEVEAIASSGTRGFGRYKRLLDKLERAEDDFNETID